MNDELKLAIYILTGIPDGQVLTEKQRAAIEVILDNYNPLLKRNEQIEAEELRSFSALSAFGVPKERARSVSNGIQILVTRMDKEIAELRIALDDVTLSEKMARIYLKYRQSMIHATSEQYFAHRDAFIAYILNDVNPARIKAGLSEIREPEARECFRIMIEFLDEWNKA